MRLLRLWCAPLCNQFPEFGGKFPARFPARNRAVLHVFRGTWGYVEGTTSCSKYRYPNG
jgi:hypothetical protein